MGSTVLVHLRNPLSVDLESLEHPVTGGDGVRETVRDRRRPLQELAWLQQDDENKTHRKHVKKKTQVQTTQHTNDHETHAKKHSVSKNT